MIKIDISELKLLDMTISSAGFKVFEDMVKKIKGDLNSVMNITDNLFYNGIAKGEVGGISLVQNLIEDIKKQLREARRGEF